MRATLYRDKQNNIATTGRICVYDNNNICILDEIFSLEPKWLENKKGISCIFADIYNCSWAEMKDHPNHFHYRLEDKHNREGVFIHYGLLETQSHACIFLGTNLKPIGNDIEILNSPETVSKFEKLFLKDKVQQDFVLTIIDYSGMTNLV